MAIPTQAPASIDAYIAAAPREVRPILTAIRETIRAAAPEAEEVISYRMPAYRMGGILVYFAAFKAHIGLFPPVSGDAGLERALAPYAGPKGNLKFPLERPMPLALIRRVVRLRVKQARARAAAGGKKRPSRPKRASDGAPGRKPNAPAASSASELISKRIAELGDWRGKTLARMRALIREADPDVVEEWKWMGTPVWSHDGILCTGESYQKAVKLTFHKGASLEDPAGLFNASLEGNARRAIDLHEGEEVDAAAFRALVRRAVALNRSKKPKPSRKA